MTKKNSRNDLPSGSMNRRDFNKILASVGVATVAFPMVQRSALGAEEANYFTWSGYDIPEFFVAYKDKHGTLPNFSNFGDEEEALTKMRAGYIPDIAHPCHYNARRWRDAGILQAIDTSRCEHWSTVFPELKTLRGTQLDGEQWFHPIDWGTMSVIYRHDLVDIEEESLSLMWDERYKGRLTVLDIAEDTLAFAGMYVGVDPFTMGGSKQDDLEKVRAALKEQKGLIRMYTSSTTDVNQALASGEVVAAYAWNSQLVSLKKDGVPIKFMRPKEGVISWVCGAVLLKDAPNPDKAYDVINSLAEPSTGKFYLEEYGYGHSNSKSFDLVSDEVIEMAELSRNPSDILGNGVFLEDFDNRGEVMKMWNEVKSGE